MVTPEAPPRREAFDHLTVDGRPKLTFLNRREARAAARRMTSKFSEKQRSYRCATCDRWHLTKSPRRSSEP